MPSSAAGPAAAVKLILAPHALQDLMRIEQALWRERGPQAAPVFAFLLDGLQSLAGQPGVGRPVGDGLRELAIRRGRDHYLARYHYDAPRQRVLVLCLRGKAELICHCGEAH